MTVLPVGAADTGATFASPKAAGRRRRLRGLVSAAVREPLAHFFLAGLILFFAVNAYKRETSVYRIEITPERVAALESSYRQQFGAPPTASAREALVDRYIDEEILFRQGVAMGLDKGDEIVRRRVVQKMQFLQQDLQPPREPSMDELRSWYSDHLGQYTVPPQVSFTHIYFSAAQDGDAGARARAQAVLARLGGNITRAPEHGDSFPDLYDYTGFGPAEAARLFGATPLAQALFSAPTGQWVGPLQSGYGWHLLYIAARRAPRTQPFEAVRDQVRADWLTAEQTRSNKHAFDTLKSHFVVVRRDRESS